MQPLGRPRHQATDRGVVAEVEPLVAAGHPRLDASRVPAPLDGDLVAGRRVVEAALHVLGLRVELGEVPAPRLAPYRDPVGHDVGRQPALDHPEVRRRLVVDAAEPHPRDGLGRHLDGADALLGADAGVGLEAVHHEAHVIGGRRARDQLVDAVAVEDEPAPGGQACDVEVLGAEQAVLLADRKEDLDRAVGQAALARETDGFEDGHDACLVGAAQDRGAVRSDDVALSDRPDVLARHDGVHVGAEEQWRGRRRGAWNTAEHVAGVPTDLRPGVIDFHLSAERFERGDQTLGHRQLVARGTRGLYELDELRDHALAVDHAASFKKRPNHSRLAATPARRWPLSLSPWSAPGMMTRSQGAFARAGGRAPGSPGTTSSASAWITRWLPTPVGALS